MSRGKLGVIQPQCLSLPELVFPNGTAPDSETRTFNEDRQSAVVELEAENENQMDKE